MTHQPTTAGDDTHQLCRLALDLSSAALALAAEAAEIACDGPPRRGHDARLMLMSGALADLVSDLDGDSDALRHARLSGAWLSCGGTDPAIPAE